MTLNNLTAGARALLTRLRAGNNVAEPPANIGEFAYSSLARAFLSNARGLCRQDGLSDFRVFGALYSFRHGVELLLKCIVRNDVMDDTLRAMMMPGLSFDQVCGSLGLNKPGKNLLQQSICAMRNVLEDRITYPDCYTRNVDTASAERSLDFLRRNRDLPRDRFGVVWTPAPFGHDLGELWSKARPTIVAMASDAERHAHESGFPAPLTSDDLDPVVELLAALDDGGDGFRYPSSLSGAWYAALPVLSLEAVGQLVGSVESTCIVFEGVREHCYSMATIGHPTPQYSGD